MSIDDVRAASEEVLSTPNTGQAWSAEPGRLIPYAYRLARFADAVLNPPDHVKRAMVKMNEGIHRDFYAATVGNWIVSLLTTAAKETTK